MMYRGFWGPLAGVALAALTSCTRHTPPAAAMPDETWRARLTKQRADKDHEFATSLDAPIAAVDTLESVTAGYLALDGQAMRFDTEPGPAARLHWQTADHQWSWQVVGDAPVNATAFHGGRTLAPGKLTESIRFALSDRVSVVAHGSTSRGTLYLTEFDAGRAERVAFKHLFYFPLDSKFVFAAKIEWIANPPGVTLATSRGTTADYLRYAILRFEIDGQPCALTAFRPAGSKDRELFVPFRDATSGKESYGAARFLDVDVPEADATTAVIDFNAAYNPLCNYSPAWYCPLPPPENTLKLAVRAGERAYPH